MSLSASSHKRRDGTRGGHERSGGAMTMNSVNIKSTVDLSGGKAFKIEVEVARLGVQCNCQSLDHRP